MLGSAAGAQAAGEASVLCSWEILVMMSHYDETCSLEENPEMTRALADSIAQLEGFIALHSGVPNTPGLLANKREALRQALVEGIEVGRASGLDPCSDKEEGGIAGLYREFARNNPPAVLRAWVTDDLAEAETRQHPLAGICI
ncbi:MAG TPA: hypothetical protein VJ822_14165 [Dongiaceae bacterium]|nr:hypothetical protein [Dongiaceae bacterium]